MKKQTTIKDIAKKLGMHHTTVSRALRNHPDVNAETRILVLDKAKEMHYVPNTFATGLRSNQSMTIGIMVPDIRPDFFSSTISHITNLAYQQGYSVMIFQSNEDVEMEKKNVTALIQNRVAGLIVSLSRNTLNNNHFKDLEALNIPVVYFDRTPIKNKIDKIQIDNFSAGFDAMQALINSGCKRLAFYAGSGDVDVFNQRKAGAIKAMNDARIGTKMQTILHGGISIDDGYNAGIKIMQMKNKPDGLVCCVDQVALGMMKAFKENKVKIPDEIAIIGFDNDPVGNMLQPSLSTMAQPIDEIAENAVTFLMNRIKDNKDLSSPQVKELKMKLINRESIAK